MKLPSLILKLFLIVFAFPGLFLTESNALDYRHPDVSLYNHWDYLYNIDKYEDMLVLYCGYQGIKFYRHEGDEWDLVQSIDTSGMACGGEVINDTLYTGDHFDDLSAFDITDINHPRLIARQPEDPGGIELYDVMRYRDILIVQVGLMSRYIATYRLEGEEFTYIDSERYDAYRHNTVMRDSLLYLCTNHGFEVRSISSEGMIDSLYMLDFETGTAFNLVVNGDVGYLSFLENRFDVVDFSDPFRPEIVSSAFTNCNKARLVHNEDYLYLIESGMMEVYSLEDPQNPAFITHHYDSRFEDLEAVFLDGNSLYLSQSQFHDTEPYGLIEVRINELEISEILPYSHRGHVRALTINGNYSYVFDDSCGLQTFDISDPLNPVQTHTIDTDSIWGLKHNDEILIGYHGGKGLEVFDITNPSWPENIFNYTTTVSSYAGNKNIFFDIINNIIALATFENYDSSTIKILEIDSEGIDEISTFDGIGNTMLSFSLDGNYLLIGRQPSSTGGIDRTTRLYDLSEPEYPNLTDSLIFQEAPSFMYPFENGFLYGISSDAYSQDVMQIQIHDEGQVNIDLEAEWTFSSAFFTQNNSFFISGNRRKGIFVFMLNENYSVNEFLNIPTTESLYNAHLDDNGFIHSIEGRSYNIYDVRYELGVNDKPDEYIPTETLLLANYPNPFNPSTTICFTLPKQGDVSLKVYNLLGKEVASLLDRQTMSAGHHTLSWDASDKGFAAGIYFAVLETENTRTVQKCLLMK